MSIYQSHPDDWPAPRDLDDTPIGLSDPAEARAAVARADAMLAGARGGHALNIELRSEA